MNNNTSSTVEKDSDFGNGDKGLQRKWLMELKLADKRESDWRKTTKLVIDKYRGKNRKKNSFNILWSNTETLMPAIYNSLPKPDVRRRFKDEDPIGKAVSEVLGRALEFQIDIEQFDTSIKHTLLDMLLGGRGVSRIRYVPRIQTYDEDTESESELDEKLESESYEELKWEQVVVEHVQYDDFRYGAGKTWADVCWVAFHHKMTRDDLVEKFGEIGEKMTLDDVNDEDVNKEDESVSDSFKTASVWEIWDKDSRKVIFISKNATIPLDVIDDPLDLEGFFPVPRPIYAVTDSSTLVPTPLYTQYQEQAEELDRISARINKLLDACKVRGIYDSTMSEVSELLKGNDNDLIPAQNAAQWLERGGIEKAIWMMPIDAAAQVIALLTAQREQCKNVIYEINGLGDILRGATNASETLGAQQIKAQWGTMRISTLQRELQRYIRDLMRIMADVIGEKFQIETLQQMTGLKYPTEASVAENETQYQQLVAMAQHTGNQPPPPPEVTNFTWESIQQILKNDAQRTYKIDVETDSTTAATVQEDTKALSDTLAGIGAFISGAIPIVQSGMITADAVKELTLVIARRSKMGNAVEDALDKMQTPKQPQQQAQQDPKIQAQAEQARLAHEGQIAQMQSQNEQAKMQMEQAKSQAQMQLDQAKIQIEQQRMQIDQMKMQSEAEMETRRMSFERWKAELDAQTKIAVAQISAQNAIDTAAMAAQSAIAGKAVDSIQKAEAGANA